MAKMGGDVQNRIQTKKKLGMMLQMMPGYLGMTPEGTERI